MSKTKISIFFGLVFLLAAEVHGDTFYVSPSGSDLNDGRSPEQAWLSIDHGDTSGAVGAGDIVNILPGVYETTNGIVLSRTGLEASPIVYRRLGRAPVIIDAMKSAQVALQIEGNYTEVYGIEFTNALSSCVRAFSRDGVLADCYIHDSDANGVLLNDLYKYLGRNVIVNNAGPGIRIDGFGDYSDIYNNTICYNGGQGILSTSAVDDVRIINNIICSNGSYGIDAQIDVRCAFNNVWDNVGTYYSGCYDSSGGINEVPLFVDPASGRYDLMSTAAEIDAGMYVDYPFNGAAPDMGAFEKYNVYYVSSVDGNDTADGLSAATAWQTIDNGDSLVYPGDTVFVLPGLYTDSIIIDSEGLQDDLISYVGSGDDCLVNVTGSGTAVMLRGSYILWSDISMCSALSNSMYLGGTQNVIENCLFNSATIGLILNSAQSLVYGNVFHNHSQVAVYDWMGDSNVYINNTFYQNEGSDFYDLFSTNKTLANNLFLTFAESDTAIWATDWSGITYCLFYGYDEAVAGGGAPGEGCLIDFDPLLIDPDGGNFHLAQASPAIDAGDDFGFPFNNYAPDIGAYETGLPFLIEIVGGPDTLVADSTYQFELNGFDSVGYPTRPGPVVWSHDFASGVISSFGVFTPGLVDTGMVIAEAAAYGLWDSTASLTVVAGELHELTISPDTGTLEVDSSHQFLLDGWDVRGNRVGDFGNITWDVLNGIGTIDQSGVFTAGNVGYGFVRATSDIGPSVMTDTLVVTVGNAEVDVSLLSIPPSELIPGESTGPILAFELSSGYISPVAVDSLRLQLAGYDPDGATQAELDSQVESVALYLEGDNQYLTLTPDDSLLAAGSLSDGSVLMITPGLIVPAAGSIRLTASVDLSMTTAKNSNTVSLGISESDEIYTQGIVSVTGAFPIENEQSFGISTFPVAAVTVNAVEAATICQDQGDRAVMDFTLPANGYADDILSSVTLLNAGTLDDNDDILDIKLWADATGDGFTADDVSLGSFSYFSGFWEIDGLSHALSGSSNRLIVTASVIGALIEGGTLELEVPTRGITYLSGTDGPDDGVIANPNSFLVIPANRITAVSVPSTSIPVTAGSAENTILTFALYNGYSVSKNLWSITFTNHSHTASTTDFADSELGQVSLHLDENHNRLFDNDPAIASGYFSGGTLTLSPSNLALPAESLCYFFVAIKLPGDGVIDSDSLTISIDRESDFLFELSEGEAVNLNGDMPLTGGGYLIIDGSVYHQYEIFPVLSGSVSTGDTSITLLALRPASNGNQVDMLTSVEVCNTGSAGPVDVERLELWLDLDDDETWQSTDSLIGVFSYATDSWIIQSIDIEVVSSGAALFVLGDISATPTPDATIDLEIPLYGCQYSSANDGPIDYPISSSASFIISASGLSISTEPLGSSYSVGQEIEVAASVGNLLESSMDSVFCHFVSVEDPADSVAVGPVSLAPDETGEFLTGFTTSQAGSRSWRVYAVSATPDDTSAVVTTEAVTVNEIPSDALVALLNSIPTVVSRGQSNVFPMSVRYYQEDTSSTRSSLRLDSLTISVEDALGQPLPANSVFSRMVLATDNLNLVVLNSIPSTSLVTLNFAEPVVLPPGEQQLLSLLVDIDSLASASTVVLGLPDQSAIGLVDHNSLDPVTFYPGLDFPMQTASCRIENPSEQLAVSGVSTLSSLVNYGQENVGAIELVLRHPGETGTSQIQLISLSVEIVDEYSAPVAASELITALRVLRQQLIAGELIVAEDTATTVTVDFGAPPTIGPGETETLLLQLDLKSQSAHDAFAVRVLDSTSLMVRDLSSGSIVTSVSDLELASSNVFPLSSDFAQLMYSATPPELCLSSTLPAYVIGGATGVELMEISVVYPATADYSSIKADDIAARLFDSEGVPLNPNELFDQIGVSIDGADVTYDPYIEFRNGLTLFHLGDEGVIIDPQDTVSIRLLADIENATPVENFKLVVQNACALSICDATDTASHLEGVLGPTCSATVPFKTPVSEVYLRAGRPGVSVDSRPALLAFPGQQSLPLKEMTFSYDSPVLQGDLVLNKIIGETVRRVTSGVSSQPSGSLFETIVIILDGDTLAVDSSLASDSVVFEFAGGFTLSRNNMYRLNILGDVRADAPLGNYLVRLADSTFCEMRDKNLLTSIYPVLGTGSYPLLSTEISLTQANLENSFTNYPNPFNPDVGEETTIGFVLQEDAYIDIDLYTITGKIVKRLASNSFRSAGAHQQDHWDACNDRGLRVLPGTYFCRLTAKYVSGRSETLKRKVSVVR